MSIQFYMDHSVLYEDPLQAFVKKIKSLLMNFKSILTNFKSRFNEFFIFIAIFSTMNHIISIKYYMDHSVFLFTNIKSIFMYLVHDLDK